MRTSYHSKNSTKNVSLGSWYFCFIETLDNIVQRDVICGDSLILMEQLRTYEWNEIKGVVIV